MANWTGAELTTLRRIYPKEGAKAAAKALGRSVDSIYCKAKQLRMKTKRAPHNAAFSDEQITAIRENRRGLNQFQLAAEYQTSQPVISKIQNRATYPFVTPVTKNNNVTECGLV